MSAFDLPGQAPASPAGAELQNDADGIELSSLSLTGLLALRNRVTALLPAVHLKDLDLASELVLQVIALQELQRLTMGDKETPANQQAQVANSLSAALVNLVKLQSEVQSTERFKRIEQAVVKFINGLEDLEQRKIAFGLYEDAVKGVSGG
jgi:hypothetical protein